MIHILLIEDNPNEAELFEAMLMSVRRFEFDLTRVDCLTKGIELTQNIQEIEKPFDVILLDLNLPDSSGFDTFDR